MTNYHRIVRRLNETDLETEVSKLIAAGYRVHGPMTIDFTQKIKEFYQPMVKELE